jgi:raffinose synthase
VYASFVSADLLHGTARIALVVGCMLQQSFPHLSSAAAAAGVLHGMARAVSGGAVYVSDKPGQHDFTLLRRLVLPDGAVLRALLPGRPTRDCLFADVLRDRQTLLKVRVVYV